MASTLNASTTGGGGIIATADSSGVLALQAGGTTVATFNATGVNAGIQVAANAAPAFSAYMSATQSISNVTATKLVFNTENFDTNSNYDTSTYRFTPTVAGYYQFSARIATPASGTGITYIYIGKNNDTSIGLNSSAGNNTNGLTVSTSGLLYMNGTTDYVEAFTYQSTGGTATMGSTSSGYANFQGVLVRSA